MNIYLLRIANEDDTYPTKIILGDEEVPEHLRKYIKYRKKLVLDSDKFLEDMNLSREDVSAIRRLDETTMFIETDIGIELYLKLYALDTKFVREITDRYFDVVEERYTFYEMSEIKPEYRFDVANREYSIVSDIIWYPEDMYAGYIMFKNPSRWEYIQQEFRELYNAGVPCFVHLS